MKPLYDVFFRNLKIGTRRANSATEALEMTTLDISVQEAK